MTFFRDFVIINKVMERIYYTDKRAFDKTDDAIRLILQRDYAIENACILRTENGKPYLENSPLFFSVSHTADTIFIAVARENVGIDAEKINRDVHLETIIKKFKNEERAEIRSKEDFLRHWIAKESAVKWLGGTLARDLYKLDYLDGKMRYGEIEMPVLFTFLRIDDTLLCVCGERDFSCAEHILLTK